MYKIEKQEGFVKWVSKLCKVETRDGSDQKRTDSRLRLRIMSYLFTTMCRVSRDNERKRVRVRHGHRSHDYFDQVCVDSGCVVTV